MTLSPEPEPKQARPSEAIPADDKAIPGTESVPTDRGIPTDRYIPGGVDAILEQLAQQLFPSRSRKFMQFGHLCHRLMAHYAGQRVLEIRRRYRKYDPDLETKAPASAASDNLDTFFDDLTEIFLQASFCKLGDESFSEMTGELKTLTKSMKIDADLESIERVMIFHRGIGERGHVVRPLKNLFRRVTVEIATYTRVAIVSRVHHDPHISIQVYKDVAQEDLELLLPTINVKMTLFDKLKVSGAGGSAAFSAFKLVRLLASAIPKLITIPFKVLFFPLLIGVGAVYGGKALLDYSKIKSQYLEALRQNLYALSLGKNATVLSLLRDAVTDESTKGLCLAYAFLLSSPTPHSSESLDACVEQYAALHHATVADFDVEAALEHLRESDLLIESEQGLSAVSLDEALWTLDHIWDELYEAPGSP